MPTNQTTPPPRRQWPMAAYQQAPIGDEELEDETLPPEEKPAKPREKFCGGWECEGKERPTNPIICIKCQWIRRNNQEVEPPFDPLLWCESCEVGNPPIGNEVNPTTPTPSTPVSRAEDVANLNRTFFG